MKESHDALGRRIAKTVDDMTTLYLPAGAQTVVELDRPALPSSQAAIDGAESDGTLENLALTPASGGFLSGPGVTRINFQPTTVAVPAGFLSDSGKAYRKQSWTCTQFRKGLIRSTLQIPLVGVRAAGPGWQRGLLHPSF